MTAQQLETVRTCLAAVIPLPAAERAAAISRLSNGDPAVAEEVRALLAVAEPATEFLAKPLPELLGASASAPAELPSGVKLKDRYRIQEKLARSDFATVYIAADELLGERRVIIKTPDPLRDNSALAATFAAELRSLSRVHHPAVVGISDVGTTHDGMPFLVLAYVPGISLRELLRRGPVPPKQALHLLQGIARALAASHAQGVWHLDLKPENVIVSEPDSGDERVTLIDFGIARLKTATHTGVTAGSPKYMAPEQHASPSASCDIYSLSLIAFELLTGGLPQQALPLAVQFPRELYKATVDVVTAGLSPDPASRPQDISRFVNAFERHRNPKPLYAAAGGLTVAAALGLALFLNSRRPNDPPQEYSSPFPVVTTPLREHRPSFSPDGKDIYYSAGPTLNQRIYRKTIGGGDSVLIGRGPTDEDRPRVSPDGRLLIFTRSRPTGKTCDLILKELTTGNERVLAADIDADTFSWMPDSKRLIGDDNANTLGGRYLFLLDVETSERTALKLPVTGACGPRHPRISPDGQTLAFACNRFRGSDDLYSVGLDPSGHPVGSARQLTHSGDRTDALEWAPDGKSLLWLRGPLGRSSVWRLFPESGAIVPVPSLPERLDSIAVPLRAWRIAFGRDMSDENLWEYDPARKNPPRQLATTSYSEEEATYSPDGRRILFASDRSGGVQAWMANADGTNARQLSNIDGGDDVTGIWTRDPSEVLISVRSKKLGEQIFLMRPDSDAPMKSFYTGGMASSMSRDGKWVYVVQNVKGHRSLVRVPFPGGGAAQLVAEECSYGIESPDGRYLYHDHNHEREGVWRKTLPDGPDVQLVKYLQRRHLFAPSQTGIYYISPALLGAPSALWFQSLSRSAPVKLYSFDMDIGWGFDLAPDERRILMVQKDAGNSDVIMIEHFR